MRTVHLIRINERNPGARAIVATIRWDGSKVTIESDYEMFRDSLKNNAVTSTSGIGSVRPEDGESFLDAVLVSYSGTRVYAEEVDA